MTGFEDLGDAEKVKFVEAELSSTLNRLDDMIAKLTGLRTEIEDPDGLVRFTLGDDGRLLTLFIDDSVRGRLNNLGLEKKLNDLFSAGNDTMRLSRKEFWDGVGEMEG
ncbi:MAG: hypothetical protein QOH91_1675 [Mycobacterium sp.]|nr:hypothetical protein [Mycobacterium sp.]